MNASQVTNMGRLRLRSLSRILFRSSLWVISVLVLLIVSVTLSGAKINTTKSIAVGLYWAIDAPIIQGAYVMFCPPQNEAIALAKQRGYIRGGRCPGEYPYLMKKVLAAKGDVVSITDSGISVNGSILPFSRPLLADANNRPLPHFRLNAYKMGDADLLLMTDVSATSYDSRYFGLVDKGQVETVIRPIYTF